MEVARIHAENAIRQKNQSLNYLKMSARVDAVASKIQSAIMTRKVTNNMAGTNFCSLVLTHQSINVI